MWRHTPRRAHATQNGRTIVILIKKMEKKHKEKTHKTMGKRGNDDEKRSREAAPKNNQAQSM